MNTYAIADVHGRLDLLQRAIEIIEKDAGAEGGKLVCLGDFIDRGPQAREVIELLMAGPQSPNWEWVVLQGNHEAMMLECLANPGILRWWLRNGGANTLLSYGYRDGDKITPLKVPDEHLNWLAALRLFHEDDHRIFVHAGVPHDQHLLDTKAETLQWMLYGEYFNDTTDLAEEMPHISGKHIVHGHHQSDRHPLLLPHRTNLDSFAWHSGRLAIGVFDGTKQGPVRIRDAIGMPHGHERAS